MTMREHLTKAAEFHLARAKSYGKLAKCVGGLMKTAKSDMGASDDREDDIDTSEVSAELVALSELEVDYATWCVSCCKSMGADELVKTVGMDRDAIMPDAVSAVYGQETENLRLVARAGSPAEGEHGKVAEVFKTVYSD